MMRVRSIQSVRSPCMGDRAHRTDSRSPLLRWHVSGIGNPPSRWQKHTGVRESISVMDRSRTAYCIVKRKNIQTVNQAACAVDTAHFIYRIVLIKPVDVSIRILEVGQPTDRGIGIFGTTIRPPAPSTRRIAASHIRYIDGIDDRLVWDPRLRITAPLIPDLRRYR